MRDGRLGGIYQTQRLAGLDLCGWNGWQNFFILNIKILEVVFLVALVAIRVYLMVMANEEGGEKVFGSGSSGYVSKSVLEM